MRNRKPGTGILDMPSQSDYTQLRTSEQSTSLNDEYHQSDSINDAPFGPDLRFIDTTLKQVAFAEVYVQVAQFVSKQEKKKKNSFTPSGRGFAFRQKPLQLPLYPPNYQNVGSSS